MIAPHNEWTSALVNVTAPDGEAAVDDREDASTTAEHHDNGQAVADAGLQVGGVEARVPWCKG